jgi:hypothetical protein
MAAPDTAALIEQSKCIEGCIPRGMLLPVLISVFAKLAGMPLDPKILIDGATCINACIPAGLQIPVLILVASNIKGGGGGTGTCLVCQSGAPIIPSTCDCALSFDNDPASPTAGSFWFWVSSTATWQPFSV